MTSHEPAIQERVASFVAGDASLAAFQRWFVPNALLVVDVIPDSATRQLVYDLELRVAEFEHGDWTIEELRTRFRELLHSFRVERRAATAVPAPRD